MILKSYTPLNLLVFFPSVFIFILVLCPSMAFAVSSDTAFVEKIIDGDTIVVNYKSKSIRVRLWGIDTPEYHQAYSRVAKRLTSNLIAGTTVSLKVKDWDDYGRMVAIVTLADNRCLNEELVKKGMAWVYIYYCKEAICDEWFDFEKRARQQHIGLWHDDTPVPPWVWKRRKHSQK